MGSNISNILITIIYTLISIHIYMNMALKKCKLYNTYSIKYALKQTSAMSAFYKTD